MGLKLVRGVSAVGHVICGVGKVVTAIGAVLILAVIVASSFMPADFVLMTTKTTGELKMNLRSVFGEEWEDVREEYEAMTSYVTADGQEITVTENGIESQIQAVETSFTNRSISVVLVPVFAELILWCALYHFGSRVFGGMRVSYVPFPSTVVEPMRTAAFLVVALQAVPYFCGLLLSLITNTQGLADTSLSLGGIFLGVLLLALSELFRLGGELGQGAKKEETPVEPPRSEF